MNRAEPRTGESARPACGLDSPLAGERAGGAADRSGTGQAAAP